MFTLEAFDDFLNKQAPCRGRKIICSVQSSESGQSLLLSGTGHFIFCHLSDVGGEDFTFYRKRGLNTCRVAPSEEFI